VDRIDPRVIELDGAFNFRDLGGLPTIDGGRTRHGVLYRSDALQHLEPSAVARLHELGISSIVDLRSESEVEQRGRGLLADEAIGWFHFPLSDIGAPGYEPPAALAAGDMGAHYVETLPGRTPQLARVIEHLADPDAVPAIFHCAAGKDRTGVVAALVLELVGVRADAIVDDYVLTDEAMPAIVQRFRGGDNATSVWNSVSGAMRAEAKSMEQFLAALEERHGGAHGWARDCGLGDDTLARLRALLVEGA